MREDVVRRLDRLAGQGIAEGDATGWFERAYAAADGDEEQLPWNRREPLGLLASWTAEHGVRGEGRRALVIGAGLGADAEHLAGLGFDTVAFDVAPTAIATARARYPESPVQYRVADLLDPPADWGGGFDLVVECYTVQALPRTLRAEATARVADMVAPGGTLVVVSFELRPGDDGQGPPWPLSREEIEAFAQDGLEMVRIERLPEPESPARPCWRAELRRPR